MLVAAAESVQRGAGVKPQAQSKWLHQDLNVNCDGDVHQGYELLAGTMIAVFAFGTPMIYWALLWRRRRNLGHADAGYLRFLVNEYTAEHWYWEIVECFRKLTLTGIALFFGEQGSLLQTAAAIGLVRQMGGLLSWREERSTETRARARPCSRCRLSCKQRPAPLSSKASCRKRAILPGLTRWPWLAPSSTPSPMPP